MDSHQLAHASFTVSGDEVSPTFWTEYFGVVPDVAHRKGDAIFDRNGQPLGIGRRTGVWGVRSKSAVKSDLLEPHLRYLVEHLGLPRADLPELLRHGNARMRFFCYWDNETGDRVPDVPDDIRAMMEAMGGTIELDEYR
ncbi:MULTISPECIES: DUF4279 domain-containing protein [unclassified Caballeronia]|uniref:DUF4279 domain-containing protein n=1 Tax=unclassified Caballeronia TaxID=2646786 RepID=UPI00285C9628|nr:MULTISPECIES: DUF4279 domain-containing protein [unclassified Caballeronia]MDR5754341.1 DUF4279 domain-containing protein [Caballeronia sp. LZ024]MDR5840719.1 DUF4279 domain-containing protein [Caballeronia sp. LZ031]